LHVGAGSGYLSACFAATIGNNGEVYMVDHIPQLVEQALKNIKNERAYLIEKNRIRPVVTDGREGHEIDGPYDVIVFSGAINHNEVSKKLQD